ncbi:diguanylate cyclase, partial [Candidatus Omnitrophota bacterium]
RYMKELILHLNKRLKILLTLLSIVIVAVICFFDYITGYRLGFSLFYVIPIAIVAWYVDRFAAIVICIISCIAWIVAELLARDYRLPSFVLYWNAGIRLTYFLIIASLLVLLKERLSHEKKFANTDFLTGVVNSRFFYELVAMELKRTQRHKGVFTVAYVDVDNFKAVNDKLGHRVGDELLRLVAQAVNSSTRDIDIVARLGGDEFIILMPLTDSEQAKIVVGRVQKSLLDVVGIKQWPVTFSIGVVTFTTAPSSVDEMISMADTMMYAAKKAGKNRIEQGTFE